VPAADYDLFREYESFGAPEGEFSLFLEIYRETGATQSDPDADQDMFFQFLNAFVPESEPQTKEFWDELRDAFYDYSGITDEDIDWELWRAAIGYG
jgi:hypothetical protein